MVKKGPKFYQKFYQVPRNLTKTQHVSGYPCAQISRAHKARGAGRKIFISSESAARSES